ncbi:MAG: DnaA/Hda family protein, partial [Gammaproteobacteria bacterium]|nr:DnaA/Hda family protein [Gammaproteobacteria bacterium]
MSVLNHPQLPLGFEPGELFTFDSFVPGNNIIATGLARQAAKGEGEKQLYFWGDSGLGKSHLLQACCNLAAKQQRTVCYLTPVEILGQSPDMFDGLELIGLICLDDIQCWLLDAVWEAALFNLINRVRENQSCLILASVHSPEDNFVKLPDLRSRLSWGPVFHL